MEKRNWGRVRSWLPKGYEWGVQWARREGRRGRAKEEMILRIKREL